ncbi:MULTISPECIES: monovalent cation/H(+) antiporter subunit G [unclassified Simplicispira]|jgi:multicomponent K+:H+ antiporter subunit G|uniref:monovalent cation/H(+) antiporter subunit G n=1 Tax=unclassified Simplicispira TaxID=2630407 RepID=UPI000D5DEE0D|nr:MULTISPECIES: monovalent cation/H(+) antiporter subunit G [unclassified Simplicispira]PVY56228.1 multisubunit potassium/proton antiporter PhaG subunit [Simplicispira sp. 125]REG17173.1 multisubunit potassium/proton antiporter PhaG subunit [Simplicispira sp. 110]
MTDQPLALWAEITIAALVLLGAVIALIGSMGLLRLKDYYERVHAPAMIATMGCWSIMHASVLFFSLQGHGFAAYPLLIAVFVAITVPVTNIFLMRAALFRARRSGQNVPASVSQTIPQTVEPQIDHS